jgi:hypothetical protein
MKGDHEYGRDRTQREGDRHAGEHNRKPGAAVDERDGRGRHSGALDGISAKNLHRKLRGEERHADRHQRIPDPHGEAHVDSE